MTPGPCSLPNLWTAIYSAETDYMESLVHAGSVLRGELRSFQTSVQIFYELLAFK